jgi:hypothetical protein
MPETVLVIPAFVTAPGESLGLILGAITLMGLLVLTAWLMGRNR